MLLTVELDVEEDDPVQDDRLARNRLPRNPVCIRNWLIGRAERDAAKRVLALRSPGIGPLEMYVSPAPLSFLLDRSSPEVLETRTSQ